MDGKLAKIYYDPSHPAAFGGISKLAKATGEPYDEVERWLQTQRAYTLHRPVRKHFKTTPYLVRGIDGQWQADLVDVSEMSKHNGNVRFLLTVIDIVSKYAYAIPLLKKTGERVAKALRKVFEMDGRQPKKLQTDMGTEFRNQWVQETLAKYGVEYFASLSKANVVERFNRTLQRKIHRYMTANATRRYTDVLQKLVDGYNSAHHRSIGMAPKEVTKDRIDEVMERLYGKRHRYMLEHRAPKLEHARFHVRDLVRTSRQQGVFDKEYRPAWTGEIFRVATRLLTRPTTYELESLDGEEITSRFYEQELQLVRPAPGKVTSLWHKRDVDRKGRVRVQIEDEGGRKRWVREDKLA